MPVRKATAQQVVQAAETLQGSMRQELFEPAFRPSRRGARFGFLMQQRGRSLYQMLGSELRAATARVNCGAWRSGGRARRDDLA